MIRAPPLFWNPWDCRFFSQFLRIFPSKFPLALVFDGMRRKASLKNYIRLATLVMIRRLFGLHVLGPSLNRRFLQIFLLHALALFYLKNDLLSAHLPFLQIVVGCQQ